MPGQTQKGNPAAHRMSNAQHKIVRARGWQNAKRRKERRIAAQRNREIENKVLRAAGRPTAWETACAERAARREAAGLHAAWLKRQVGN